MNETYLPPRAVMARLGISTATYYRWLRDGRLRGVRVGGRWRFPAAAVDDLAAGGVALAEETAALEEAWRLVAPPKRRGGDLAGFLIEDAVRAGADTLHVEPSSDGVVIRRRIDGALAPMPKPLPARAGPPLLRALRARAGFADVAGRRIEVRAQPYPTDIGESLTLRLLDPARAIRRLDRLGLDARTRRGVEELLARGRGLFVVNGPTDSGKTTTLYALLAHLRRPDRKIMTAEDPVEVHLDGIQQANVDEELGFADALLAMLRSGVNVAMLSEIRDRRTLELAFTAAHTGRLVLTSLHCTDGLHAVRKMLEIGIPPGTLADNLLGVLTQRLVRRKGRVLKADLLTMTPRLRKAIGAGELRPTVHSV